MGLEDLERLDAALLIGSCTRKEHPIVNHRLRKASLAGAAVTYLDVMAHDLNLAPAARMVVPPPALAGALAAVTVAAARIAGREPEGLGALAGGIEGAGIEQAGSASAPGASGDIEGVASGMGIDPAEIDPSRTAADRCRAGRRRAHRAHADRCRT